MKIVFNGIQADGQGNFFAQDEVSGERYFHFLTQIKDKIKLKATLQKYLDDVKTQETKKLSIKTDINAVIATLKN